MARKRKAFFMETLLLCRLEAEKLDIFLKKSIGITFYCGQSTFSVSPLHNRILNRVLSSEIYIVYIQVESKKSFLRVKIFIVCTMAISIEMTYFLQ